MPSNWRLHVCRKFYCINDGVRRTCLRGANGSELWCVGEPAPDATGVFEAEGTSGNAEGFRPIRDNIDHAADVYREEFDRSLERAHSELPKLAGEITDHSYDTFREKLERDLVATTGLGLSSIVKWAVGLSIALIVSLFLIGIGLIGLWFKRA